MELEEINSDEIVKLEIATGDPLTYEYSMGSIKKQIKLVQLFRSPSLHLLPLES